MLIFHLPGLFLLQQLTFPISANSAPTILQVPIRLPPICIERGRSVTRVWKGGLESKTFSSFSYSKNTSQSMIGTCFSFKMSPCILWRTCSFLFTWYVLFLHISFDFFIFTSLPSTFMLVSSLKPKWYAYSLCRPCGFLMCSKTVLKIYSVNYKWIWRIF